MELILASTSPYRQQLLKNHKIPFKAVSPQCDEDSFKALYKDPLILTQILAKSKAESLRADHTSDLIVGSDQVLVFNNEIFGKPKTKERALEQLRTLQNQRHQLVTSMYVCGPSKNWTHTEVVELTMHPWTDEELLRYIDLDDPLDCAGSYKLECGGLALFSKIKSEDYESIIGLPMIHLISILKEVRFRFF